MTNDDSRPFRIICNRERFPASQFRTDTWTNLEFVLLASNGGAVVSDEGRMISLLGRHRDGIGGEDNRLAVEYCSNPHFVLSGCQRR